jgi:hypothetical protein
MTTNHEKRPRILAAAWMSLTLALASCGEPTAEEALKSKDYAEAAELFQAQIATAEPVEDAWLRAVGGRIEALAHVDAAKAKQEVSEIIARHGQALGERKVGGLAQKLSAGGAHEVALEVLNATVATWPVSMDLDSIHSQVLEQYLASMSAADAAKALEGLGYAGGGEKQWTPRKGSQTPDPKSVKE